MTGADAFPYPEDDPEAIRNLSRLLVDASNAVSGGISVVGQARATLEARWRSPAGGRAVAEVDAIGTLGDEAVAALADAQGLLDGYASAIDEARAVIDWLRSEYDGALVDYDASVAALVAREGSPARVMTHRLDEAAASRDGRISELRTRYDEVLAGVEEAAVRAGGELTAIAGRISPAPESRNGDLVRARVLDRLPFMAAHTGVTVIDTGEHVIIDTTHGEDDVRVRHDHDTGGVTVTVNGIQYAFDAKQASQLVIRTNGGSDIIDVDPGAQLGFTLLSGSGADLVAGANGNDIIRTGDGGDSVIGGGGDDTIDAGAHNDIVVDGPTILLTPASLRRLEGARPIEQRSSGGNDTVVGSYGNDYVDAGAGDDRVWGSAGDDVVYGGEGDDIVDGGTGSDYLDGYLGNDQLSGGNQQDVLSGGAGDDHLRGGLDDDVTYTGAGRDAVDDRDGANTVYHQADDAVTVGQASRKVTVEIAAIPDTIRIEGTPEFVARVRADLETLASSPTGSQMLHHLGEHGDGPLWFDGDILTIKEGGGLGSRTEARDGDAMIRYDTSTFPYDQPANGDNQVPPVMVLQHEMAHVYDIMSEGAVAYVGPPSGAAWYLGPDAGEMPTEVYTPDARFPRSIQIDANDDGRISFDEIDRDNDGDIDDLDLDLNADGDVDVRDGWVPNLERQAVGLPIDHDGNPDTPAVPAADRPGALTENALRQEMGYRPRPTYRGTREGDR